MSRVSNLRELQADLCVKVGKLVGNLGFRPERFVYRRLIERGSQTLHLSFINHRTDFDVTVDVAIRFDDVQALLDEIENKPSPANESTRMSFGAELGNIKDGHQRRWTVREEKDVDRTALEIASAFKEIGFKYLESLSDRRMALDALAKDDRGAWLHMPVHSARAMLALALCVVLNDQKRFEQLFEEKHKVLELRNDAGLKKVWEFAQKMRGHFGS